jgi:DNA adenine methylase
MNAITETKTNPFLKWVGGKRQLIPELIANLPPDWDTENNRYYEPFIGGGALLFELQPKRAIVGDINPELMNCYYCVKHYLDRVLVALSKCENTKENYYSIRNLDRSAEPISQIARAARFIYLNRTCYRGLHRVNKQGQFNTPYGNYKTIDYDQDNLQAVSEYLSKYSIEFLNSDWREIARLPFRGDFIYLDPPYDPASKTSNFTAYSNHGFGEREQIELKAAIDHLTKKGVYVMQSNSATPFIIDLYGNYRKITVDAHRAINNKKGTRAKVQELIITNY